jgi:hypothetical protein
LSRRNLIKIPRNKGQATRNEIKARRNKNQIRRNEIQMPLPSANPAFSKAYRRFQEAEDVRRPLA